MPDKSHGYDDHADDYATRRSNTIGVKEVEAWANRLKKSAAVLDLGCGNGSPLGDALTRTGCDLHGIDASPRMLAAFTRRLPHAHARCEAVEDSSFFNRPFDGILAWGLLFLLPLGAQERVIAKAAHALDKDGSLLFTSPAQPSEWRDTLTGQPSESPGADAYRRMLATNGLTLVRECDDEGGNHYYEAVKR